MLDVAIDAGAAYAGLVFEPRSVRDISIKQAAQLTAHAGQRIKIVALFVDPIDTLIDEVAEIVKPHMLQLHGKESVERTGLIKQRAGLPIIKAIGVRDSSDPAKARPYVDVADLILFDTKPLEDTQNVLPGGSGQAFDWNLVHNALNCPFMLAGGLRSENVQTAIEQSGAGSVDVSSAVENAPGQKDAGLIREFIAAAHGSLGSKAPN